MLKKWYLLMLLFTLVAMGLRKLPLTGEASSAPAEAPRNLIEIQTKQVNVSAEGSRDIVQLAGRKQNNASTAYNELTINVFDGGTRERKASLSLKGGYNPRMRFCDLNGDKTNEMLVSVETESSGGAVDLAIYSLKEFKPAGIPNPPELTATGSLEDHYAAKVKVAEANRTFSLDLKDKMAAYEQMGIYRGGKLVKPVELKVHPYSIWTAKDLDRDGVCELRGVQRISGVGHEDTVGNAQSVWKLKGSEWKPIDIRIEK